MYSMRIVQLKMQNKAKYKISTILQHNLIMKLKMLISIQHV